MTQIPLSQKTLRRLGRAVVVRGKPHSDLWWERQWQRAHDGWVRSDDGSIIGYWTRFKDGRLNVREYFPATQLRTCEFCDVIGGPQRVRDADYYTLEGLLSSRIKDQYLIAESKVCHLCARCLKRLRPHQQRMDDVQEIRTLLNRLGKAITNVHGTKNQNDRGSAGGVSGYLDKGGKWSDRYAKSQSDPQAGPCDQRQLLCREQDRRAAITAPTRSQEIRHDGNFARQRRRRASLKSSLNEVLAGMREKV